jgi:hypothetical protein
MALARLAMVSLLLVGTLLPLAGANAAESRRPPTSSSEIWDRWLEFLGDGDRAASKARFEEIFGFELSRTQSLSDGAFRQTARIERSEGRFLLAAVDSYPRENTYGLAALQWTSHFFAGGECLDVKALTADLEKLGWTASVPPTPVGALFRKGYAEFAYSHHWGPHFHYCGLSLRPHRFGGERLERVGTGFVEFLEYPK